MRPKAEPALGGLLCNLTFVREAHFSTSLSSIHAWIKLFFKTFNGSLPELCSAVTSLNNTVNVLSQTFEFLFITETALLGNPSLVLESLLMLTINLLNKLVNTSPLFSSSNSQVGTPWVSTLSLYLLTLFISLGQALLKFLAWGCRFVLSSFETLTYLLEVFRCLIHSLVAYNNHFHSKGNWWLFADEFFQVFHLIYIIQISTLVKFIARVIPCYGEV